MKDIRRVFEYHGAEHKTINCLGRVLSMIFNIKLYNFIINLKLTKNTDKQAIIMLVKNIPKKLSTKKLGLEPKIIVRIKAYNVSQNIIIN